RASRAFSHGPGRAGPRPETNRRERRALRRSQGRFLGRKECAKQPHEVSRRGPALAERTAMLSVRKSRPDGTPAAIHGESVIRSAWQRGGWSGGRFGWALPTLGNFSGGSRGAGRPRVTIVRQEGLAGTRAHTLRSPKAGAETRDRVE